MSAEARKPVAGDLPATLPIFPLPGVLLLPEGHLPLHVFEARYLHMIEDALGNGRMIGMVQPRAQQPHPVPDMAPLYPTACAGRIVSFAETEDGRFFITLRGVCRFRIVREAPPLRGYRRATADYQPFRRDLDATSEDRIDRARLLAAAQQFFRRNDAESEWSAVKDAPDQALLTALSMMCPFDPSEKQALLECAGSGERSEMLISLLEMAVHQGKASDAKAHH